MCKQLPFWLIAFAVLIGITVPALIKDGMFMDAMLYTSVSHNLSEGIGTFWFPQFSMLNMSGLSSFHEQPPLVFGIQAVFYKILGDSFYTERVYVFVTMCITAWLIVLLWKEVVPDKSLKGMGWMPIIIWITIPDCYWSFSENMMENTMGIFTLASGLFAFKALKSERFRVSYFAMSGAFIFLATFSKGVPGFFTIAMPFMYWYIIRKISFTRMLLASAVMIAIPILIYAVLLIFPVSRESLSLYFFDRLVGRINNEPSVSSRLNILWHILSELIPQLILMLLVLLITGIKKVKTAIDSENTRLIIFFVLSALAGSLPMMLTRVQSGWYIVPTYPFFAIAISLFVAALLARPISLINSSSKSYKIFATLSVIALIAVIGISISQIGKPGRDKNKIHDVYVMGKAITKYSTVSVPQDLWNDWEVQCYLMRYFNISIDPVNKLKYYMIDPQNHDTPPAGYVKLNLGLLKYDLYKKE